MTTKTNRNPRDVCITITLPKLLHTAIKRRADEKCSSASGVIRDYLIPIFADRDPEFNRAWSNIYRGV